MNQIKCCGDEVLDKKVVEDVKEMYMGSNIVFHFSIPLGKLKPSWVGASSHMVQPKFHQVFRCFEYYKCSMSFNRFPLPDIT